MWKRREAVLRYKWNLLKLDRDTQVRPEYRQKATSKRFNRYTHKYDMYIPQRLQLLRLFISYSCCLVLASIVIFSVLAISALRFYIVFEINVKYKILREDIRTFANMLSPTLMFCLMQAFDQIFKRLAIKLTDFETPRTQDQYDRSYIIKVHVLSMINAYALLYYTAFVRGKFKTHPGDMRQYQGIGILNNDQGEPLGILTPLSIQLIILFSAKTIIKCVWQLAIPMVWKLYKKQRLSLHSSDYEKLNSWERDFFRLKNYRYHLAINEYRTIFNQFGFIVLFPAAFPLAALVAFVMNVIELRINAIKYLQWHRRDIPRRVQGLGAWNTIFVTLSYIGIVTNCFLIAFTESLEYYMRVLFLESNIEPINATFSVFAVEDFPEDTAFHNSTSIRYCLYKGKRFPPTDPRKYQNNKYYWFTLSCQMLIVILLEAIVLGFNKLLSFAIPDIPKDIQQRIYSQETRENAARQKRCKDLLDKPERNPSIYTREQITARLARMQED